MTHLRPCTLRTHEADGLTGHYQFFLNSSVWFDAPFVELLSVGGKVTLRGVTANIRAFLDPTSDILAEVVR
jgi:hypothetical protein